jgi:hypothetical protein
MTKGGDAMSDDSARTVKEETSVETRREMVEEPDGRDIQVDDDETSDEEE